MKRVYNYIAASFGNLIEWYDFMLFALLAKQIGATFFTSSSENVQILAAYGLFAAASIFRPLGGLFFGFLADKYSRKLSLILSVAIMAISSIAIGIIPSYSSAGVLSPIVLLLCRILQACAMGGEFSSSVVFVYEHSKRRGKGFAAALNWTGSILGILIATGIILLNQSIFSTTEITAWAWRLPFLFSLILMAIALLLRKNMKESPHHIFLKNKKSPVKEALLHNWPQILSIAGKYAGVTAVFYCLFSFSITWIITQAHMTYADAMDINAISLIALIPLTLLSGVLIDRIQSRRVAIISWCLLCIAPYFVFSELASPGLLSDVVSEIIMGFLFVFVLIEFMITGPELLPEHSRATGYSVAINICASIIGTSAPFVVQFAITVTASSYAPAIYLSSMALISLLATAFSPVWKKYYAKSESPS